MKHYYKLRELVVDAIVLVAAISLINLILRF